MKKTRRTSKVGEMIRSTLVEVIRQDLSDLNLGMASITEVEVSPDLHYARVFMSGLDEKETKDAVAQLQAHKSRARRGLGNRIRLRYTPELEFRFDDTTMRAGRIELILSQLRPATQEEVVEDDDATQETDTDDASDGRSVEEHND